MTSRLKSTHKGEACHQAAQQGGNDEDGYPGDDDGNDGLRPVQADGFFDGNGRGDGAQHGTGQPNNTDQAEESGANNSQDDKKADNAPDGGQAHGAHQLVERSGGLEHGFGHEHHHVDANCKGDHADDYADDSADERASGNRGCRAEITQAAQSADGHGGDSRCRQIGGELIQQIDADYDAPCSGR